MCLIRLRIFIGHLYLSGMWIGAAPIPYTKKATRVFTTDWIACSKVDNHSRFDSQHNREEPRVHKSISDTSSTDLST